MKVSNLADVGQMRRSRGISMNMMTKEDIKQTMLKAMTKLAWKILAMPRAKQRIMHSTPVH